MEHEIGATAAEDLERLLRDAGPELLLALVRGHAAAMSAAAARQALRNPYLSSEVVDLLAAQPRLLAFYEVRRDLVRCPCCSEALALRHLAGLFWRDLVAIGLDTRLHPRLRSAADSQVAARLSALSVGERVTIARRASAAVVAQLLSDPSPRVIAAVLDNPRLTEGALARLAHRETAPAPILRLIAEDRRWGARYDIRVALARNPRTPAATALRLLATLRKPDLATVASDPRVEDAVRRRARLLLGQVEGA
jgi:hypothetical protein